MTHGPPLLASRRSVSENVKRELGVVCVHGVLGLIRSPRFAIRTCGSEPLLH
jgi:hypothetical protein